MGACCAQPESDQPLVIKTPAKTNSFVAKPAAQMPAKAEPVKVEPVDASPAATQLNEAQPIATEEPADAEPSELTSISKVREDIDDTIYFRTWTGDHK